ncbi:50S ribosomal protein L2 [Candidatus Vidania fulgoroideorum]
MIKKKNPTSPGVRGKVYLKNFFSFFKKRKKLIFKIQSKSGRNNQGKITTQHKGGGVKKKYRNIDFLRNKYYVYGTVKSLEYDPNRNSIINLISYKDGEFKYNLFIKGLKIGDKILSGKNISPKLGYCMQLKNIPIGIKICCVENIPGKGAVYCRSSGSFCKIISKDKKCLIKMNSGNIKKFNLNCFATIGEIGNGNYYLKKKGKAGVNRNKGIRPTVRGVAMNPIDHPHGGGEGKTSTKRHPVNFKGKLSKGFKTRRNV